MYTRFITVTVIVFMCAQPLPLVIHYCAKWHIEKFIVWTWMIDNKDTFVLAFKVTVCATLLMFFVNACCQLLLALPKRSTKHWFFWLKCIWKCWTSTEIGNLMFLASSWKYFFLFLSFYLVPTAVEGCIWGGCVESFMQNLQIWKIVLVFNRNDKNVKVFVN